MSTHSSDRHDIRVSVDIARPPAMVFDYLRDIETRLRLNPSYHLTGFEWVPPGPPGPGSRYHVHARVGESNLDYLCEVIELVEGERLATRGVDSGMMVRLTLDPIPGGCRLTHEEGFQVPEEALQPPPGSGRALMANLLVALFGQREVSVLKAEREKHVQVTVAELEQRLRRWLERVRQDIERGHS
jgi:uncharacterized protein YndB with AHSA1/START domain